LASQISLILPAYNEAGRIANTVGEAVQYFRGRGLSYEIIVAADGDDGTREIVADMARSDRGLRVIGRPGRHIARSDALSHIFGYTCFNDGSIRDIQFKHSIAAGKNFHATGGFGPWIVTADEIPDPHDLAMQLRVNGEVRQESHSSRMAVTIPEIISHYSPMGYSAGDIVSTGTVAGVAGFSEDAASLYLRPGDVVEAEIDGIGVLRNPVISWAEGHPGASQPAIERASA